jgi:hypothetical protein
VWNQDKKTGPKDGSLGGLWRRTFLSEIRDPNVADPSAGPTKGCPTYDAPPFQSSRKESHPERAKENEDFFPHLLNETRNFPFYS